MYITGEIGTTMQHCKYTNHIRIAVMLAIGAICLQGTLFTDWPPKWLIFAALACFIIPTGILLFGATIADVSRYLGFGLLPGILVLASAHPLAACIPAIIAYYLIAEAQILRIEEQPAPMGAAQPTTLRRESE